ncbi:toll/interleukin-1 receptor domain-containing protein [Niallia taxi]|uniref:toll/interleukin-1 receptor domain-containing protein n=1 Tax=Niallia taxi TaxID=2499688 RepID=UPI003981B254
MTKVFISYSHSNKDIARKIAYDLEFNEIDVWYDDFEIKFGDNIIAKLEDGIEESDFFLVLLSEESITSNYIKMEIEFSISQNKKIILISLDDVKIENFLYPQYNFIDFSKSYSKGFKSLINKIKQDKNQDKNSEHKYNDYIDSIKKDYILDIINNVEPKSIPEFYNNSYLPKGTHVIRINEFFYRFTSIKERVKYRQALVNIFNFAKTKQAKSIIFGGSFITSKTIPSDIDCILVFEHTSEIPGDFSKLVVDNTPIDAYYASLDDISILQTLISSFSKDRNGNEIGVIKIDLEDSYIENIHEFIDNSPIDKYENSTYSFKPKGILVTVHGLLSRAEWNTKIAPIASSQGWIFAPYVYKTNRVDLLIRKKKRKKVVDEFRDWIFDLKLKYKGIPISIISHSFGTYIIAQYLEGFDKKSPVSFQSIILTGSIISRDFDWYKHYMNSKVIRVRNEVAINDNFVKIMPEGFLKLDKMFGKSGVKGFNNTCHILEEKRNNIFDHNNVIRADVVETLWMPYLNANSQLKS